MHKVVMYDSDDGQSFTTEEDCLKYEEMVKNVKEANEMFASGINLFLCLSKANSNRPEWCHQITIQDLAFLYTLTKDTPILANTTVGTHMVEEITKTADLIVRGRERKIMTLETLIRLSKI